MTEGINTIPFAHVLQTGEEVLKQKAKARLDAAVNAWIVQMEHVKWNDLMTFMAEHHQDYLPLFFGTSHRRYNDFPTDLQYSDEVLEQVCQRLQTLTGLYWSVYETGSEDYPKYACRALRFRVNSKTALTTAPLTMNRRLFNWHIKQLGWPMETANTPQVCEGPTRSGTASKPTSCIIS